MRSAELRCKPGKDRGAPPEVARRHRKRLFDFEISAGLDDPAHAVQGRAVCDPLSVQLIREHQPEIGVVVGGRIFRAGPLRANPGDDGLGGDRQAHQREDIGLEVEGDIAGIQTRAPGALRRPPDVLTDASMRIQDTGSCLTFFPDARKGPVAVAGTEVRQEIHQ